MNRLLLIAVPCAVLGLASCKKPVEVDVLPPPAAASATPEASQASNNTRVEALPASSPASSQ